MAESISTKQAEIDHLRWLAVAESIVTGKLRITVWSEAKAVAFGLRHFRKDPIVRKALDAICRSPLSESGSNGNFVSVSEAELKKRLLAICQDLPYTSVYSPLTLQSEPE